MFSPGHPQHPSVETHLYTYQVSSTIKWRLSWILCCIEKPLLNNSSEQVPLFVTKFSCLFFLGGGAIIFCFFFSFFSFFYFAHLNKLSDSADAENVCINFSHRNKLPIYLYTYTVRKQIFHLLNAIFTLKVGDVASAELISTHCHSQSQDRFLNAYRSPLGFKLSCEC